MEMEKPAVGFESEGSGRGGEMVLVVRGRREVKPLLLKVGVALALSFAGFLFSQLRSRSQPRPRPLPPPSSVGCEPEPSGKPSSGLKEELVVLKNEQALTKIVNGTSTTATRTAATTATTFLGLSPISKRSIIEEGFLLPEFNDLVMKGFEVTRPDPETSPPTPTAKHSETNEEAVMEQEIAQLRNLVWSLRERERSLELELLEYYGMQEQEAAMTELENQLKINNVEAKLYNLKIESLQSENRRLQGQVSVHSRAISELDAARANIRLLKKKLKSDAEQAKEKIASLHQRVRVLQCRVQNDENNEQELKNKLKRLKELVIEAAGLKMVNSKLAQENSDLMQKLEKMEMSASSIHKGPQVKELEEVDSLRRENNKLTKDIEQLQTDRCTDVEELVYLRWVNACLRYELRNYQPPQGKTAARDLSKTLSPKSEEKAKQLILEYANSGADEKSLGLLEFDSEYSSSSQASTVENDDTSVEISSTKNSNLSKSKFFGKLKKLVLGKEIHSNTTGRTSTNCSNSERRMSSCSFDDTIGRESYRSCSSCMTEELTPANQLSWMEVEPDEQRPSKDPGLHNYARHSLDIQRFRRLNVEDVVHEKGEHNRAGDGTPFRYKTMVTSAGINQNNLLDGDESYIPDKGELKKFADALRKSRADRRSSRRSASFSN
ncbi:protein CHUP1, chloroplastic-like isoform X1 [Typha angustifolia]|uniref:protein CHUP1, chloroplastic-like isoform X1 n=1 Tax=Typha angustifolia TaxID=59011 RepID=UPI003C2CE846